MHSLELEGVVAQVSGEPDLEEPAEDGGEIGCSCIAGRKGSNRKDQMGSKNACL